MNTKHLNRSDNSVQPYGLLVSAGIALLFAIGVLVMTGSFVVAIACAVPIGVTLGIAISEDAGSRPLDAKRKALLALALVVGVTILVALAVLAA